MGKLLIGCMLLLLAGSLSSCETKEEGCYTTETVDGIIKWSGDYAVDGCGYFLMVGEKEFKPTNETAIPDTYKAGGWEGTQVEVRILNYQKQISAGCQLPYQTNAAKILEIRKR